MTSEAQAMLSGLAVATMFRGDPRQLVRWCNYHLQAGVERLYVVLDRPEEGLCDALPSDPRVIYVPLDQDTWSRFYARNADNVERKQVDALRWIARRAQAEGHAHLAFVDADELIDLAVPFADLAEEYADVPALTLPVREMWYAAGGHTDDPFGATLALRWEAGGGVWNDVFDWRAQYFRKGVLGHDAGKTIYALPLASGAISVHGPLDGVLRGRGARLPDSSGRLLHFDSGDLATWNHKWASRISGDALAHGLGGHRRAQLRLFSYELRRSPADQRRFFESFFSLEESAVASLESAGLLDHVDVAEQMSGPLAVPPAGDATLVQFPGVGDRVDYQFAMVCDRNFVKPTFATLVSVLAQTDPTKSVRVVILGDGLAESDVSYFKALERTAYDVEVQVHDVTGDLDRDVGQDLHKRSRATYGRVYLVDLLPEQRTVYLDGDVLATRDISELFELDLGDACIAGVPDSAALRMAANPSAVAIEQRMRLTGIAGRDPLEYVNAGVLVLDLDHPDYRELALRSRAHVSMEGRALAQHDQDAINLAFRGRKHRLPSIYNYMTQFYTSERALDGDLIALKYAAADASLIHFSGKVKPWVSSEDEYYNGLYRRIVAAAEARVGVSCGFYFSKSRLPDRRDWSGERWAENLAPVAPAETPAPSTRDVDIAVVDVTDTAIYLRIATESYRHAVAGGLRLEVRDGDEVLNEIPLDRFGPIQTHLAERAGPGIRMAPIDLPAVLAGHGGVARRVEFVLVWPAAPTEFRRSLGVIEVLATTAAATPDLLDELGVEGEITSFDKGVLRGWYRPLHDEAIALHLGDELVAARLKGTEEDGVRAFRFWAERIAKEGYGADRDNISIRVAGTNLALPGLTLTVGEARHPRPAGARGAARPAAPAAAQRSLVQRVRGRLGRRVSQ